MMLNTLVAITALITTVCPEKTAVVVELNARRLHLCDQGQRHASYHVALGTGGIKKRRRGDAKTPVGTYRLGKPRPSVSGFLTFIPVGYPTKKQRKLGFTGGSIGIHGPPRGFESRYDGTAEDDWTLGCIALGTDAEITAIARWVRRVRARSIELRP